MHAYKTRRHMSYKDHKWNLHATDQKQIGHKHSYVEKILTE